MDFLLNINNGEEHIIDCKESTLQNEDIKLNKIELDRINILNENNEKNIEKEEKDNQNREKNETEDIKENEIIENTKEKENSKEDNNIEDISKKIPEKDKIIETQNIDNENKSIKVENKHDYDTLVLSGGSTKGIITLGALQFAYDNYLLNNIKTYIGTSAGAMISYLLAIGYTPIEIIVYICKNQLMEKMQHFNIVAMINGSGAVSFNNISENLEKMTIEKIGYLPTIKDLKNNFGKTLICITYNLTEDKTEYISPDNYPELPCLIALRMSANLPLIFETFKYGNSFYIDGGISDNFGINIGDDMGKKVLGILLGSKDNSNFNKYPDMDILEFIYKIMFIPISNNIESKLQNISDKCKIIKLNYDKLKFFNFNVNSKLKLDLFSYGYSEMKRQLEL